MSHCYTKKAWGAQRGCFVLGRECTEQLLGVWRAYGGCTERCRVIARCMEGTQRGIKKCLGVWRDTQQLLDVWRVCKGAQSSS